MTYKSVKHTKQMPQADNKNFLAYKDKQQQTEKKDKHQVNRGNNKRKKMEVYWAHFMKGQK